MALAMAPRKRKLHPASSSAGDGSSSSAAAAAASPSDSKIPTSTADRRLLRSHYRLLKASIKEEKPHLARADSHSFDSLVQRVDDLHSLVCRPREQIADAEALLDITHGLLSSVKDSRRGGGVSVAELVSAIVQGLARPSGEDEGVQIDWDALGLEANAVLHDAPGFCTMLGPMDSEPKRRRVTAPRRRDRAQSAETTRPETVEDGDQRTETDKNIRAMFNILRKGKKDGFPLEALILSRESFSETVENIFFLSFLVKDGRAEISVVDGKQIVAFRYAPSAEERSGRAASEHPVVNSQFVFRLDFKDWMKMKEFVRNGEELMPRRKQASTSMTPIRKNSRNRGRETSTEFDNREVRLGDDDDEEGDDVAMERQQAAAAAATRRSIL